jgi:DNA-nicking Smr family endonuclease
VSARGRKLAPEEAALWARVIETVKPLPKRKISPPPPEAAPPKPAPIVAKAPPKPLKLKPAGLPHPNPSPKGEGLEKKKAPVPKAAETLDGSWDRKLSRGLVSPESSVDLHGHSLASAHARLDRGLDLALARGDRLLLLITGKPPGPESERPHKRGAIRAAVGDWIAGSRFSDRIAAVRGAHPRHGGTGALYIVLRRPKLPQERPAPRKS